MSGISRRELLKLGAAGSLLGSLPAWAQQSADARVLRVAVQQVVNAGTLESLREQSNVGMRIMPMIFAQLIELSKDGKLVPGLAESWKSVDAQTLEVKIRTGAKFHNGDDVTAEDVAFSFGPERMLGDTQSNTGSGTQTISTTSSHAPAKGSDKAAPPEVYAVGRRLFPSLLEVKVIDAHTVHFVNAVPDLTLAGRLARIGCDVISKKAFLAAKTWNEWALNPVSAGPFRVAEFKNDNILVLKAHEGYFKGRPNVDEVRYLVVPEVASRVNGLLAGDYHFATDIPPDQIKTIEANSAFEVVGGPVFNHRIVVFDHNNAVLKNPKVRQALSHSIDRQAIVDALWDGRTEVPRGLQWSFYGDMYVADWEVPKFDPELAKKLLDEAGYKGETIGYRVLNNYYTNQTQTAQILAEMWRAVGIKVDMQMKENWQQIFERGDARAIRDWSNSAAFNDPVSSLVNQHGPNGQQQQMGEWSNEEFNRLCAVLENSTDPAERKTSFRRMLEIAEREDPAYTVLHQNAVFYGKRKDISWDWSPNFMMDFRADNLKLSS